MARWTDWSRAWWMNCTHGGILAVLVDIACSKATPSAVGKLLDGRAVPEHPPRGESQANGAVEEAGKSCRGLVKVYKDQMEYKAGIKLLDTDVVLQWAVRWAAMVHSRFMIGGDGKTANERQKGRKCDLEVLPFGEAVLYKRTKRIW